MAEVEVSRVRHGFLRVKGLVEPPTQLFITPDEADALLAALLREKGYDLKALVDAYHLQQIRAGRYTAVPRQQGEGE